MIQTGLKPLDDLLGGGIRPGEICLVQGRSGQGKTAFCNAVALHNGVKHIPSFPAGGQDLVVVGDGIKFHHRDYEVPEEEHVLPWQRMGTVVRRMRNYAVENNVAIFFSFHYTALGEEGIVNNEALRHADQAVLCRKERVQLFKNRRGGSGSVFVKVERINRTAVMKCRNT